MSTPPRTPLRSDPAEVSAATRWAVGQRRLAPGGRLTADTLAEFRAARPDPPPTPAQAPSPASPPVFSHREGAS